MEASTLQFQILIQNFLEGWGNKNSHDFKCPGQDSVNLQNTSLTMKLGFTL